MRPQSILSCFLFVLLIAGACKKPAGCTDPNATNYDPEAEVWDASCEYHGCTDTASLNYSPSATVDDGSCSYPGNVKLYTNRIKSAVQVVHFLFEGEQVGFRTFGCQFNDPCGRAISCDYYELEAVTPGTYTAQAIIMDYSASPIDTVEVAPVVTFTALADQCVGVEL